MLRYQRNKLVNVSWDGGEVLKIRGVLDDDLYSIELELSFSFPDLEILAIDGCWHRWTTPECRRSDQFLQEAVGWKMDGDFKENVKKIISRKSCRHYANLLLECAHTAREAVQVIQWEEAKKDQPDLTFQAFLQGAEPVKPPPAEPEKPRVEVTETPPPRAMEKPPEPIKRASSGGQVIDLHLHTFPASPCASSSVDDMIAEAKRVGLDGVCLTDHNFSWSARDIEDLRQKHGFLVLGGNEILTDQGDVLVFGLTQPVNGLIRLTELKKETDVSGGFIIVAHPFRGFLVVGVGQTGLSLERAMGRSMFKSVDAVEVLNGKVTENENRFALEVAQGLNLPTVGGSDAHSVDEVGVYATEFSDPIAGEADLVRALKEGRYSPVVFREV